jgi:hypothetical protein
MCDSTQKDVIEPQFKVEMRVSYVALDQDIEVPLGYYLGQQWEPYEFVEGNGGSLVLTPDELSDWLAEPDFFGSPFIWSIEEARRAVAQTIERCRTLAEAARRNKQQT